MKNYIINQLSKRIRDTFALTTVLILGIQVIVSAQFLDLSQYIYHERSVTGVTMGLLQSIEIKAISKNGTYIIGRYPSPSGATSGSYDIFRAKLNTDRNALVELATFSAGNSAEARDVANDGTFVYHIIPTGGAVGSEVAFIGSMVATFPGLGSTNCTITSSLSTDTGVLFANMPLGAGVGPGNGVMATSIALTDSANTYYVGYNETYYNNTSAVATDDFLSNAAGIATSFYAGYQALISANTTYKRGMIANIKLNLIENKFSTITKKEVAPGFWRSEKRLWSEVHAVNASGDGAGGYWGAFKGGYFNTNPVPAIFSLRSNNLYKAEVYGEGVVGGFRGMNYADEAVGDFLTEQSNSIRGLFSSACFANSDSWTDATPDENGILFDLNNDGMAVGARSGQAFYIRTCGNCDVIKGPLKDLIVSSPGGAALATYKFKNAKDISNDNVIIGIMDKQSGTDNLRAYIFKLQGNSSGANTALDMIAFPENGKVYENKPMALRLNSSVDASKIEWVFAKYSIRNPNAKPRKWHKVENPDKFFLNPIYDEGDTVIYPYGKWRIRAKVKNTCEFQEVIVEFLDRGLYICGPDGRQYKINKNLEGLPEGILNKDMNIGVYIHGWQNDRVNKNGRENVIYNDVISTSVDPTLTGINLPFISPPQKGTINMVPIWNNKGYNLLMYHWTQQADDTGDPDSQIVYSSSEFDAQIRIITGTGISSPLVPFERIKAGPDYTVNFAQDSVSIIYAAPDFINIPLFASLGAITVPMPNIPGKLGISLPAFGGSTIKFPKVITAVDPVTGDELKGGVAYHFAQSMNQFMQDFRGLGGAASEDTEIRVVGHSLGSNVAILGGAQMKDHITRLDLADPYFGGTIATYAPSLKFLKDSGTAITTYSTTEMNLVLRIANPLANIGVGLLPLNPMFVPENEVFQLYDSTAFIRVWPEWASTKSLDFGQKMIDIHNAGKWYALHIHTPVMEPSLTVERNGGLLAPIAWATLPADTFPNTTFVGMKKMLSPKDMWVWPWSIELNTLSPLATFKGFYKHFIPYKVSYPGSCYGVAKALMKYRTEQVWGGNTIDPSDDYYRVVKTAPENNPTIDNPLGTDKAILEGTAP